MRDEEKSKEQLIAELINLRKTLTENELCKFQSVGNCTEALSNANKRNLDILSHITIGILVLDNEWKLTYINKIAQNILNKALEELLGSLFWDVIPNENPTFYENFHKAVFEQKNIRFETFSLTLNSWLEIDVFPSSEGVTALFRDITKRKIDEDNIRFSEELFSTTFELSPILMTLEDLKTGEFVRVNKTFEESTGYLSTEVLGKTSVEFNLLPDNDDQTLLDMYLDNGQVKNQEIDFKTKSGRIRVGLFSTHIIKVNKTEFLLVSAMDITELCQFRKEVRRLDRLDLIGQMAAAISHEVRNPITVVKGFLQIFSTKPQYHADDEYLQLMISELDRANSIITNFLSVSRTKSSEYEKLNLNKIIDFIYPLINADALKRDMDIILDLNQVPDLILDKEEMKQLILNLVRNGLEAMSAAGCITISTRCRNEDVILSIRDEGKGFPQEVLHKIGAPFVTTKSNGTGLGLAVCYGIVSKHGGKINVDTSPKGTIFRVEFPIRTSKCFLP